jgi:hypothetical protein
LCSYKNETEETQLGQHKNTSNNEEIESGDEALEKALREPADPLPYHGGKAWQGASMDKKSTLPKEASTQKNEC